MTIMLSSFLKDCGDERHRQLGASITTVFRTGLAATANCLSRCFGILPTLQILAGPLTVGHSAPCNGHPLLPCVHKKPVLVCLGSKFCGFYGINLLDRYRGLSDRPASSNTSSLLWVS